MALSTMAVFGSAFFTPIVVGKIADTIGWEWSFYLVAIFAGALLPLLFFFCPETAFVRDNALDTDITGRVIRTDNPTSTPSHNLQNLDEFGSSGNLRSQTFEKGFASAENTQELPSSSFSTDNPPAQRHTYTQTLSLFNGRKSDESFFTLLLRPFPLFLHPGILWACLTQGVLIGWTVLIGIVLAAIFLAPPLYFTATDVGYMYTSAFVGALIGFLICGLLSDWSAKAMMRANRGVYEPEFRMLLVIPQLIFGCGGLYAFGITAGDTYRYGWLAPCISFAFVTAGMVCGAVASSLYLVDAHRDVAIEGFTCLMIFKNLFCFALTFRGYDWLIGEGGPRRIFVVVGSVQVGVCALTVGMCKFDFSFLPLFSLLSSLFFSFFFFFI